MFRGTMPPRDLKEAGARQKRFIEQPSSTGIQILSGPKTNRAILRRGNCGIREKVVEDPEFWDDLADSFCSLSGNSLNYLDERNHQLIGVGHGNECWGARELAS
jgi:hypothetical protein